MDDLQAIAGRLAAGATGRTEADIQSDVRKFLLDAPLDLKDGELPDISLEAQAGGGRRIDVEAGTAAIEVKKSLSSPTVITAATEQLSGYVRQRSEETQQRYVGILTDGRTWLLHHLLLDNSLAEVGRFELTGPSDAPRLAAWLEAVLATTDQIVPTPRAVVAKLGAGSPGFQLDLSDLRELHRACKTDPEVQLKRELWDRLLRAALGTSFEGSDELFVTHTYLVLTAELIAHALAGVPIDTPGSNVRELLEGRHFEQAGLHGVVEADFFDWPAVHPEGGQVVRAIARRLAGFDWTQVEHDVLKVLYESVIDADTRHKLGEYYTPDWLAQRTVERLITTPLEQRVLDPSCGSGTFLFWAIRHVLAAADAAGLSNRDAVNTVVSRVHGIDLHPVAVTLARVTYLLAIGRDRLESGTRGELTVPVYLGDAVRWEQDATLLHQDGLVVRTSDKLELVEQELHFPEAILEDPISFDRLVAALADRAANRPAVPHSKASAKKTQAMVPAITGILNTHHVPAADRAAVELVFEKLCRLHDAGRDHVWGYYIRNLARPLSFTRPDGHVDVLIGNPPWLAYRHMPQVLQERYRALATPRGLWAGGKVATNQDLSDLFVARAVEQYLKPGGRFSFVMPFAVLSRRQYAGFRSANWASQGAGTQAVAFDQAEDYARVKPPLFPVPACVITGTKTTKPKALTADALTFRGKVPSRHATWPEASAGLTTAEGDVARARDEHESPYRARFTQGANVVPRMLLCAEELPAGGLGLAAGRKRMRSARSANEKQPWKSLPALEHVVEDAFVFPMHLGSTIVAHRARTPWTTILPIHDGQLLDSTSPTLDEHPGFAAWWREAERLWFKHRSPATKLTLHGQIDFQNKLTKQLPDAPHRVVYTKSGQHLAACRIEDTAAIIDHKLYWAATDTIAEARYLTGIFNSGALASAVAPLQARGQHNPRDFDMHVFKLGFPAYDPDQDLHASIADHVETAEQVAAAIALDPAWQFQKARRVTREALREHGIANELDQLVTELLAATAPPVAVAALSASGA